MWDRRRSTAVLGCTALGGEEVGWSVDLRSGRIRVVSVSSAGATHCFRAREVGRLTPAPGRGGPYSASLTGSPVPVQAFETVQEAVSWALASMPARLRPLSRPATPSAAQGQRAPKGMSHRTGWCGAFEVQWTLCADSTVQIQACALEPGQWSSLDLLAGRVQRRGVSTLGFTPDGCQLPARFGNELEAAAYLAGRQVAALLRQGVPTGVAA